MNMSQELFGKFTSKCPFAVLTQAVIRSTIEDGLDDVFEAERSQQYNSEVAFSAVAMAVADVTLQHSDNFNQAYKQHRQQLGVSSQSYYDKIKATELPVSAGVVKFSAERAAEMQDELDFVPWETLPGYRVYSIDGNHLPATEKRLEPLRDVHDAPLPGTVVARFDHQRQLFDRAYLLADAHAQESTTHDQVLADLQPGDVLMADRHHCVLGFLKGIDEAGAAFVIRQHGRFKGVLIGQRKKIGRSETGVVYEQEILTSEKPDALKMRRITVELDQPTRDGDTAVHVLTNLPATDDAITISNLYRLRWEEETGFNYLTTTLTCELATVSHPKAALFLFCMAMLSFNIRQVVFAALFAEHEDEEVAEVSHFHVSKEISKFTEGMLVAIDEAMWDELLPGTTKGVAEFMRRIARSIDLKKYKKSRRGPKIKQAKKRPHRKKDHVSTAKLLAEAAIQRP